MMNWLSKIRKGEAVKGVADKNNKKAETVKTLSDVKPENAFLFALGEGSFTGKSAQNLDSLCEEMKTIDLKSVEFHLLRRDFESWIRYLGDDTLALQIAKIRNMPFDGEETRGMIVEVINKRINKSKSLESSS
jgi:hypothetical protein